MLDTVIMGSPRLHAVGREREALYAKSDFTDADGMRASELEAEFARAGRLGGRGPGGDAPRRARGARVATTRSS